MTTLAPEAPDRASPIPTRAVHPPSAPPTPYTRERRPLGDPTPLACTVARAALEAVTGAGGLERLTRWVTPEVRATLARQAALAERAGLRSNRPVTILRIRVCRVARRAAETSLVADDGERVRAIAARFEDVGGRWQATALDVG